MKRKLFMALAAVTFTAVTLHAQTTTWKIDPNHSEVNFQVRHLAVSTVRGVINGVKGTVTLNEKDITKSSVDATMDTTTVYTGTPARDKDLKSANYFNVETNPQMTFKSTSITNSGGKLKLTGDLTLVGVTKSITLDLDGPSAPQTDAKGVTRTGFSASGVLSRKDFDFGQKTPGNAGISDEVKFTIDVELDKQP